MSGRNVTAEHLADMFHENTGASFLDSGSAYGRNHERNRGVDFETLPATTLDCSRGEIMVTHNAYHFAKQHLTWDEEANRALLVMRRWLRMVGEDDYMRERSHFPTFFAAYKARKDESDREDCETCEGTGTTWGDDVPSTCTSCTGRGYRHTSTLTWSRGTFITSGVEDPTGIYGDGSPIDINTYNEENLLSQTLLFTYFEIEREGYVVLQVHGGCDVRGGYTDPQVFTIGRFDDTGFFDYRRATVYCTGKGPYQITESLDLPGFPPTGTYHDHYWTTDDGSRWYAEGSCGRGAKAQLESYETAIIDPEHFATLLADSEDPTVPMQEDGGTTYVAGWTRGVLCYTEDGEGFCPHCGGKLAAGT